MNFIAPYVLYTIYQAPLCVRFKHSIHLKYVYQYHDENASLLFYILHTLPWVLERIGYRSKRKANKQFDYKVKQPARNTPPAPPPPPPSSSPPIRTLYKKLVKIVEKVCVLNLNFGTHNLPKMLNA